MSTQRSDGFVCNCGFDAEAAVAHCMLSHVRLVVRPAGGQTETLASRGVCIEGESQPLGSPGGDGGSHR